VPHDALERGHRQQHLAARVKAGRNVDGEKSRGEGGRVKVVLALDA
jgi:hypothetical protein